MSKHELIPVSDLIDTFQIRGETDDETVLKYAEAFESYHGWGPFPELTVVNITDDAQFPPGLYIADGLHRYRAAKLADVGIVEIACEVFDGDRSVLYAKSLARNSIQGLGMDRETIRNARELIICDLWPTRQYTPAQLAEICQCSDETIRKYIKRLTDAGRVPVVESIVGADGKEYPTAKNSVSKKLGTEKPPQTSPARPTVPTDGAPKPLFCHNGCGTPIWTDLIGNPESTYCEMGGHWFCCPECMDEWDAARKSAAATDLTGIPETLPPTPSAALPTRPNPSLEPSHPAQPVDPIEEEVKPRETHKQSVVLEIGFQCEVDGTVDFDEAMTILKEELPRLTAGSRVKISKNFDVINININNILNNNLKQQKFREEKTRFKFKLSGGKVFYLGTAQFEDWKQAYPMLDMEVVMQDCMRWNNQGSGSGLVPFQKLYQRIESFLINQRDKARPQNKPRRQVDETAFTTQEGYE